MSHCLDFQAYCKGSLIYSYNNKLLKWTGSEKGNQNDKMCGSTLLWGRVTTVGTFYFREVSRRRHDRDKIDMLGER